MLGQRIIVALILKYNVVVIHSLLIVSCYIASFWQLRASRKWTSLLSFGCFLNMNVSVEGMNFLKWFLFGFAIFILLERLVITVKNGIDVARSLGVSEEVLDQVRQKLVENKQ